MQASQTIHQSGSQALEPGFAGRAKHGYRFLRQRPVLSYIADFICQELMLITEVDGITHSYKDPWKPDQERQKELKQIGFAVLMFTDEEVLRDLSNVERVIEHWVLDHLPALPSKGDKI